jgi:hypothetical protein
MVVIKPSALAFPVRRGGNHKQAKRSFPRAALPKYAGHFLTIGKEKRPALSQYPSLNDPEGFTKIERRQGFAASVAPGIVTEFPFDPALIVTVALDTHFSSRISSSTLLWNSVWP